MSDNLTLAEIEQRIADLTRDIDAIVFPPNRSGENRRITAELRAKRRPLVSERSSLRILREQLLAGASGGGQSPSKPPSPQRPTQGSSGDVNQLTSQFQKLAIDTKNDASKKRVNQANQRRQNQQLAKSRRAAQRAKSSDSIQAFIDRVSDLLTGIANPQSDLDLNVALDSVTNDLRSVNQGMRQLSNLATSSQVSNQISALALQIETSINQLIDAINKHTEDSLKEQELRLQADEAAKKANVQARRIAAADQADANSRAEDRVKLLEQREKDYSEDDISIAITNTVVNDEQTFAYIDSQLRLRQGVDGLLLSLTGSDDSEDIVSTSSNKNVDKTITMRYNAPTLKLFFERLLKNFLEFAYRADRTVFYKSLDEDGNPAKQDNNKDDIELTKDQVLTDVFLITIQPILYLITREIQRKIADDVNNNVALEANAFLRNLTSWLFVKIACGVEDDDVSVFRTQNQDGVNDQVAQAVAKPNSAFSWSNAFTRDANLKRVFSSLLGNNETPELFKQLKTIVKDAADIDNNSKLNLLNGTGVNTNRGDNDLFDGTILTGSLTGDLFQRSTQPSTAIERALILVMRASTVDDYGIAFEKYLSDKPLAPGISDTRTARLKLAEKYLNASFTLSVQDFTNAEIESGFDQIFASPDLIGKALYIHGTELERMFMLPNLEMFGMLSEQGLTPPHGGATWRDNYSHLSTLIPNAWVVDFQKQLLQFNDSQKVKTAAQMTTVMFGKSENQKAILDNPPTIGAIQLKARPIDESPLSQLGAFASELAWWVWFMKKLKDGAASTKLQSVNVLKRATLMIIGNAMFTPFIYEYEKDQNGQADAQDFVTRFGRRPFIKDFMTDKLLTIETAARANQGNPYSHDVLTVGSAAPHKLQPYGTQQSTVETGLSFTQNVRKLLGTKLSKKIRKSKLAPQFNRWIAAAKTTVLGDGKTTFDYIDDSTPDDPVTVLVPINDAWNSMVQSANNDLAKYGGSGIVAAYHVILGDIELEKLGKVGTQFTTVRGETITIETDGKTSAGEVRLKINGYSNVVIKPGESGFFGKASAGRFYITNFSPLPPTLEYQEAVDDWSSDADSSENELEGDRAANTEVFNRRTGRVVEPGNLGNVGREDRIDTILPPPPVELTRANTKLTTQTEARADGDCTSSESSSCSSSNGDLNCPDDRPLQPRVNYSLGGQPQRVGDSSSESSSMTSSDDESVEPYDENQRLQQDRAALDALLEASGLTSTLIQLSKSVQLTVFAPTAAIQRAARSQISQLTKENLAMIVQYHVIRGQYNASDVMRLYNAASAGNEQGMAKTLAFETISKTNNGVANLLLVKDRPAARSLGAFSQELYLSDIVESRFYNDENRPGPILVHFIDRILNIGNANRQLPPKDRLLIANPKDVVLASMQQTGAKASIAKTVESAPLAASFNPAEFATVHSAVQRKLSVARNEKDALDRTKELDSAFKSAGATALCQHYGQAKLKRMLKSAKTSLITNVDLNAKAKAESLETLDNMIAQV